MPERQKQKVTEQDTDTTYTVSIKFKPEQLGLARNKEQEQPPAKGTASEYPGELRGVYIISVAARILEMHPQTLRKYERLGLVTPSRTIGMLRLYSQEDIEKLRLIRHLEENLGLNLAGVEFTLDLVSQLLEMYQKLTMMKEAQQFAQMMEQEIAQLFRRLNLPIQEEASPGKGQE